MILINASENSFCMHSAPRPIFLQEKSLSTKKSRRTPKVALPPKAPVKSCPVKRIFTQLSYGDEPKPVSFREDSDTSFITDSQYYSSKKAASYFEQCFVVEEKIGTGSFGEVFRVRSKEDGELYACKRTLLKYRGEFDRSQRVQEVRKHEGLPSHPNCVRFYRAWEERQQLYLLTEICDKSLAQIAEDKHELPESLVWSYLVDLLQGIDHLHSQNLVHMDVKPENIFIGKDGLCKLGDFGLVLDFNKGPVTEGLEGDPKYLAPECLNGQFSTAVDMFSLGMTILEIATDLDLPKQGPHWHQLRNGQLPSVAQGLSKDLQHILLGLLNPDPSKRMTAKEILKLPSVRRVIAVRNVKIKITAFVALVQKMIWRVWFIFLLCFNFVWQPAFNIVSGLTLLRQDAPYIRASVMADATDNDQYSEDEMFDSSSLALPLTDVSSSSSEMNIMKPGHRFVNIVNSTPIDFQGITEGQVQQSHCKQSFQSTPKLDESPTFSRSHSRGHKQHSPEDNLSNLSSFGAFNFTSRNLMDLFNAVETEDE